MIYILVGGSGAGKTSLGEKLRENGTNKIVSHTTRKMRVGEVDGKDYYFVSRDEFMAVEKLEYEEYANNYYGISLEEFNKWSNSSEDVYVVMEIKGARNVRNLMPDSTRIVYIGVELEEMKKRMTARGDSEEAIKERLDTAIKNNEMGNMQYADYVIMNDDFEKTLEVLMDIMAKEGALSKIV